MRASLIVFPTCSSALLQYPLSLIVVCCMLQRASRVSAHVQAAQPPTDSRPAAKGGGVATSPASKVSRRQATPPRLAPPRRCWVRSPARTQTPLPTVARCLREWVAGPRDSEVQGA